MKNIIRIVSVILALTVIISSFGAGAREYYPGYEYMEDIFEFDVGAFVEKDITETGEDGEAAVDADAARIALLDTVGVWDDASKSADELVSMTEFSIIMAKLRLGSENAFEGIYDINPDSEYATYNHAYMYLVEALGYSHKCSNYPDAPDASLIVAAEIGLMEARPQNAGAYISRGELAKLVSKALTIDMCIMEHTGSGGYKYVVVDGKNLLNSVHGIYEITGFVNAIPGLSVYGGSSVKEGYIQVDRRNICTNGMDLTGYFANRVHIYASLDEETNIYNVIYIDYAEDNTVLEIEFRDIISMNSHTLSYFGDNDEELEIDIDDFTYITENGKKLTSLSEMSSFKENEGKIVFTSTTRSGEYDAAVICKYNYYVVNNVDTRLSRIAFRYGRKYEGAGYIQIDTHKVNNIYLNGLKTVYDQIPMGSAIRVFQNPESGYTEIVASNTEVISGEVSGIYENYVTVAGKEYRLARDWEAFVEENRNNTAIEYNSRPKRLELGSQVTLFVIDGVIAGYASSEDYTYGYIRSITKERTTIDPDITFRIFTQDGEWRNLTITDKCELDGEKSVSKERVLEIISASMNTPNPVTDHPVRFKANGKNELLALDTIIESRFEIDTTDDITFNGYTNLTKDWTNENIRFSSYFVSPEATFFVVPNGTIKEEDFKISTYNGLDTGDNGIAVKLYNINEYRQLELVVVTQSTSGGVSSGGGITAFYVESVRKTVIDPDDQIYGYKVVGTQFKGISRGSGTLIDASYYVTEDMLDTNKEDEEYSRDNVIEVGDVINISIMGTEIVSWEMLCKDGRLPDYAPEGETNFVKVSTDGYFGRGTFVRADPEQKIYVIKVDGVEYPVIPTCPVIVNPETRQIVMGTTTDFEEGDEIYYHSNYGRSGFFVKSE